MQCNFFATADDLLPVFSRIESKYALQYTPAGWFDSASLESLEDGASLPTLREAPPAHINFAYLVTPRDVLVKSRVIKQTDGSVTYAFDELNNPRRITFEHGGFFSESTLVRGRVGTVSDVRLAIGPRASREYDLIE